MHLSPALLTAALKGIKQLPTGRHADGRNLYLKVRDNGSMAWVFMFNAGGKRTELGLGSFTGAGAASRLTLAEARMKADEVRASIAKGINPVVTREKAKLSRAATFQHILDQYLTVVPALKQWKREADGTYTQETTWRSSFREHAQQMMNKPVDAIDAGLVGRVLLPIWGRKVGEDLRNRIEQVLEHAKGLGHREGMDNAAAWGGQLKALLISKPSIKGKAVDSHAALHYDEVPAFMTKLAQFSGNGAKALAFTILTAARTDEARLARWSEIDMEKAIWTIPADRMKAGRAHVVPLSTLAIELLRSITRSDEKIAGDFVFSGQNGVIGPTALSDKLCHDAKRGGMGLKGVATVHGFRSTFRTWASKRGFADKVAEMALAHTIGTKVTRAYDRDDLIEERTKLLQAWADHCEGKSNVVQLVRAA